MTNLPRFLVIGAMKAGTTTLYEDLRQIPGVWLPPEKEPEDLIHPRVETPEGLRDYSRKFSGCPAGAIAGDASTAYAKRPTFEGVAERAKRLLGPDISIIYMTRHPIKRVVSHYHHLWGMKLEPRQLNDAVANDSQYLSYSRYSWQLEPWLAEFGASRILVVPMEDYLGKRSETLATICAFLGIEAGEIAPDETHRNKSDGKHFVPRGGLTERFASSRFYQFGIKPIFSSAMRDRFKALVLPKTAKLDEKLDDALRLKLEAKLRDDPLAAAYLAD